MLTDKDLEKVVTEQTSVIKTKVQKMFEMQNELNLLINPEWFTEEKQKAGWNFQRAISVELAELMDHFGYKWWKHQSPDVDQCKLEVIDITHFYISHLIQKSMQESANPFYYVEGFSKELKPLEVNKDTESIRSAIDFFMAQSGNYVFDITDLNYLLNLFNITSDELCNTYIIKNTLNIFRARNGYKAGTYIKTWGGREDNEVLMEVSKLLDSNSLTYADELYTKLTEEYSKYN